MDVVEDRLERVVMAPVACCLLLLVRSVARCANVEQSWPKFTQTGARIGTI